MHQAEGKNESADPTSSKAPPSGRFFMDKYKAPPSERSQKVMHSAQSSEYLVTWEMSSGDLGAPPCRNRP